MKKLNQNRRPSSGLRDLSTFSSFLLFYCVFFLVLACFFFVFLRVSVNALTKRSMKVTEEMLHTGLLQLESTLDTYQSAAMSMNRLSSISKVSALNPEDLSRSFSAGKKTENFYHIKKAQEDFTASAMYLPNKTDIGFILQNGVVLTRQRFHLNAGELYGGFLACDGCGSAEEWTAFLSEGQNAGLLPLRSYTTYDNGTYSGLTYCLRFPISSSRHTAWFYVIIGEEQLLSILLHNSTFFSGSLTLTDPRGTVLYAKGGDREGSYSDAICITGDSGLSVEFRMPRVLSRAELRDFYLTALLFSVGYILLGIVLMVMFSYQSTRPTRLIFDAANALDETGALDPAASHRFATRESRRILDVLNQSGLALQAYSNELTRQAENLQYYTFVTLLENGPVFLSEDSARFVRKKLPARVLLVKPGGEPESGGLLLRMREVLPAGSLCYPLQGNLAALIFDRDFPGDGGLSGLQSALEPEGSLVLSPVCADPRAVYEEYTRAYYQLRFSGRRSPGPQAPEETGTAALYTPQPTISRAIVVKMLLAGQIDGLLGLLDEYEASASPSEDALKYVFYACTSALSQFRGIPGIALPPLPEYPSRGTSLFNDLRKLLQDAGAAVSRYYDQASSLWADEVMGFIRENLGNPGLYVQMVTEAFGISEGELQSMVKAASGLTFFAYVESLRMTEARRLLEETDLPINAVGERCGYASRVTFSRAYKRFYHVNPSGHRKG